MGFDHRSPATAAPTIVQYWDAGEPPGYLQPELSTFAEVNPGFSHRVFSRDSATEFIAEHFGPREVAAFRSCAVPSMQSDYLRFCAGLVLDGFYSDVDFRCTAPLERLLPPPGSIRLFLGPRGNVISGFFAFHASGHPFLELSLEIATANIERRSPGSVYFVAGPPIFTGLVCLYAVSSRDGSIAPLEDRPLQGAIHEYWKTIGDSERVAAALERVELLPGELFRAHVEPTGPLPYKSTETHWLNFKGAIFADAS
jgi:mannosyltransferase OCH1-like enzyme